MLQNDLIVIVLDSQNIVILLMNSLQSLGWLVGLAEGSPYGTYFLWRHRATGCNGSVSHNYVWTNVRHIWSIWTFVRCLARGILLKVTTVTLYLSISFNKVTFPMRKHRLLSTNFTRCVTKHPLRNTDGKMP